MPRHLHHPGRLVLLLLVPLLCLLPGVAAAQGTPTPESTEAIWQTLDGVEEAVVRTWGDVPEGTPTADDPASTRFLTGLVVEFDSNDNATTGLEPLRDWMLASLQVNLVDVDVTEEIGDVSNFGDAASVVRAVGTAADSPLAIVVLIGQVDNRLLAVGGSVRADEDLLPVIQDIAAAMLQGEPSDDPIEMGEQGRFMGGNWAIFPEEGDEALDGMRHQADLPIYTVPESTPAG